METTRLDELPPVVRFPVIYRIRVRYKLVGDLVPAPIPDFPVEDDNGEVSMSE